MMNNNKGFTLIEMLVVVAIIGILTAAVLVALGPSRDKAKDARIISALSQLRSLLETEYNPSTGTYPATIPTTGPFATATGDITANGGSATYSTSDGNKAYILQSVLNSGEYWCVDSNGFSGQLVGEAQGNFCNSTN